MIDRPKALAVLLNLKTLDGFDAVLDALEETVVIDLNDPATENLVADAIQRLHPDGWAPLSQRYPWRFPEAGRCGAQNPYGPPQLSCDLRAGHTGQHETPWREGRAYWEQL